jgi:hypothetical protein
VAHHNRHRPHRARSLRPPDGDGASVAAPVTDLGATARIRRHEVLGGLIQSTNGPHNHQKSTAKSQVTGYCEVMEPTRTAAARPSHTKPPATAPAPRGPDTRRYHTPTRQPRRRRGWRRGRSRSRGPGRRPGAQIPPARGGQPCRRPVVGILKASGAACVISLSSLPAFPQAGGLTHTALSGSRDSGSRDRTRTYNLPVNSRTLCRLSYAGPSHPAGRRGRKPEAAEPVWCCG